MYKAGSARIKTGSPTICANKDARLRREAGKLYKEINRNLINARLGIGAPRGGHPVAAEEHFNGVIIANVPECVVGHSANIYANNIIFPFFLWCWWHWFS